MQTPKLTLSESWTFDHCSHTSEENQHDLSLCFKHGKLSNTDYKAIHIGADSGSITYDV